MNTPPSNLEVLDIDHLGIVAGIIDEIGIVESVNELLGEHPQEQVSLGQVLKAMILNALGFVSAPLYLFEQFFIGKATEHLIGEGVKPEHLNDDRLGRSLDKFYQYGVTELFTAIAMKGAQTYEVALGSAHLDSSSFCVSGEYETGVTQGTQHEDGSAIETCEDPGVIEITHGYSRDHRPDLKQFLVDLVSSADGDVPLYLRLGSGNEADKAVFVQVIQEYRKQWHFEGLFVVDSALFSAENLRQLCSIQWLTRVPLTLKEAKQVLQEIQTSDWQATELEGYRFVECRRQYAAIEQRWIVIESEKRRLADLKQSQKQMDQQTTQQQARLQKLCYQSFACEPDAQAALAQFERSLKWHRLEAVNIVAQAHYPKSGRPGKGQTPTQMSYHIQATLAPDIAVVNQAQKSAGQFILATNVLENEDLTPSQALGEYKDQQTAERGFRFLKDPLFFTSSVFLKSPKRIMALAMVMGVSLLVYTLAQRKLRQALQSAQTGIKNQLKKVTDRPTLRWVFQSFQAVHLVIIEGVQQVSNLTAERQQILRFLGAACGRYYLLC
jgi:transposase